MQKDLPPASCKILQLFFFNLDVREVIRLKLEAKGSMKIVDNFIRKHGKKNNIVVSISHEWDVDGDTIKKDYDAFTAASKDFEQEEILKKILDGLDAVLDK